MGLKKRNKDARHIIDGACNPVAIADAIHEHSLEMLSEGEGMDGIRGDPALRLMVYQLAHLFGVFTLPGTEFCRLMSEVEEN